MNQQRKSPLEEVVFNFGNQYKVITNHPYLTWKVLWGEKEIGSFYFPEADAWQPERTVTIARARYCFEQLTIEVPKPKS